MKRQQGVAAIILVLILIPLFGSVFFALEGTRYIQKKTRLADASEAAALAITDQNPNKLNIYTNANTQNTTIITSSDIKAKIAKDYIDDYVRNILSDNITITPEVLINNNENDTSYFQYNVNVTTTHSSWFFNELIPSFNKTQNITATALARNYPKLTGDQPIDLVFVADFSGSMKENVISSYKEENVNECTKWDTYTKIEHDPIHDDSCNQIGYKYNNYYEHWDYKYQCTDYNTCLEYKNTIKHTPVYDTKINILKKSIIDISSSILEVKTSSAKPEKLNRITFTAFDYNTYSRIKIINCNRLKCQYERYNYKNGYQYQNSIKQSFYQTNNSYNKILNKIFSINKNKEVDKRYNFNNSYDFYDLPFTYEKINIIKNIENMYPENGGTAAYEGILRGANLLEQGTNIMDYDNRKKILILLSDGEESEPSKLQRLVDYGLCDDIRSHFSSNNNKMFMGMVGIGYRASHIGVFHQCFDGIYTTNPDDIKDSNIIDAQDLSTLTDKIKELIRKGQQTDGISKLSDGQN